MNAAAVIFLRGVDPIGVPFASANVLVREVWMAVVNRAGVLRAQANE